MSTLNMGPMVVKMRQAIVAAAAALTPLRAGTSDDPTRTLCVSAITAYNDYKLLRNPFLQTKHWVQSKQDIEQDMLTLESDMARIHAYFEAYVFAPIPGVVVDGLIFASLDSVSKGAGITLTNGNLRFSCTAANAFARSTLGKRGGKVYAELKTIAGQVMPEFGVTSNPSVSLRTGGYCYNPILGQIKIPSGSIVAFGAAVAPGAEVVFGLELDLVSRLLTVYNEGVKVSSIELIETNQDTVYYFSVDGTNTATGEINFGALPTKFKRSSDVDHGWFIPAP